MKILIHPYTSKLPNGQRNAKQYPYFRELGVLLHQDKNILHQIGIEGEEGLNWDEFIKDLKMDEIRELLPQYDFFISCDSFLQHIAASINFRGVVIWSKSDPEIFGYPLHVNIYNPLWFRQNQHAVWYGEPYEEDKFPSYQEVYDIIRNEFYEL